MWLVSWTSLDSLRSTCPYLIPWSCITSSVLNWPLESPCDLVKQKLTCVWAVSYRGWYWSWEFHTVPSKRLSNRICPLLLHVYLPTSEGKLFSPKKATRGCNSNYAALTVIILWSVVLCLSHYPEYLIGILWELHLTSCTWTIAACSQIIARRKAMSKWSSRVHKNRCSWFLTA